VAEVVRAECERRSEMIRAGAAKVVAQLTAEDSLYVQLLPDDKCESVQIRLRISEDPVPRHSSTLRFAMLDALKCAFVRHLPAPAQLNAVVLSSDELRLSTFEEDAGARTQRAALDEKITRVRTAAHGLICALDVDQATPLDGVWLRRLQEEHGLPTEDPVLEYKEPVQAEKEAVALEADPMDKENLGN